MSTTYTATLMDCPVSDADKREAETKFCAALEAALGGADQVAAAYMDYMAAFNAHSSIPLPAEASEAERVAVTSWNEAEFAGCSAAFKGWYRWPEAANFEISV